MNIEEIRLNESATILCYLEESESVKKPVIVICPGGGYLVHSEKESEPIALHFLEKGFACFILKYSLGADRKHPEKGLDFDAKYPKQAIETLETLHLLHENAERFKIDSSAIFLMGFSAGGHVSAAAAVRWNDPELIEQLPFIPKGDELKPRGVVLGYPMLGNNSPDFKKWQKENISERENRILGFLDPVLFGHSDVTAEERVKIDLWNYVSSDMPEAFIWHSIDDPIVDAKNTSRFVIKMQETGVPCEYHLYAHGGHGLALAKEERDIHLWSEMALLWMNRLMQKEESL